MQWFFFWRVIDKYKAAFISVAREGKGGSTTAVIYLQTLDNIEYSNEATGNSQ